MWNEEPLVAAIGRPTRAPGLVTQRGVVAEFVGGRLTRLRFTPSFEALPGRLSWSGPAPAAFVFVRGDRATPDSEVAVLGPLLLRFILRNGARTSFTIQAIDDAAALPHKPLTRVLETLPLSAAEGRWDGFDLAVAVRAVVR